jgi:hypothetical protein
MFVQREAGKLAFCATTVDHCLLIASKNDTWVQQQIQMLQSKNEEVTVETGDELVFIGM